MDAHVRLHCELTGFLRQHCPARDQRHLVLLVWSYAQRFFCEQLLRDQTPITHRTWLSRESQARDVSGSQAKRTRHDTPPTNAEAVRYNKTPVNAWPHCMSFQNSEE